MEKYKSLSVEEKTEYWREHIRKWRESGLSQALYCRQNEINKNAFTWRKRRIEGNKNSRITKVSKQLVDEILQYQSTIVLTVNGNLRITVERNFDPEFLQRLLKTLGAYDANKLG